MFRGHSLSRTCFVIILFAALIPVLLCGYLWQRDLQQLSEHPAFNHSLGQHRAVAAADVAPPLSSWHPLLPITAVALLMLLLALVVARLLTQRARHAMHEFATHFADVSQAGGQFDRTMVPYAELLPLVDGANRMVAQRNESECQLRRSEQRFQLALEAAGCHLWEMDLAGNQVSISVSESLIRYLAWGDVAQPMTLEQTRSWVHPLDIERFMVVIENRGEIEMLELRLRTGAGDYRWFGCRGGVVASDEAQRPLRALGTAIDITVHKTVEAEVIAARAAAEDANHAKNQFLSSISHELLTPLNGVLGYTQLLLRDANASSEQRHQLAAIKSCGQHLLTLINDVLDLARIESGRLELNEQPCDLYQLLQGVGDIARERADSKMLQFALEVAPEVPVEVVLDEVKLRQILVNLLGNAVKFTHRGGVTLRVRGGGGGRPLWFQVIDTGIGIDAGRQQTLLQPGLFGRGGTGLGLVISQRLCELMGGRIEVQSAPAAGSTFSFALPCRVVMPAAGRQPPHTGVSRRDAEWQAVQRLPAPVLVALRSAVSLGDLEALSSELQRLQSGSDSVLARRLVQLAESFDIETLRELLAPDCASV